MNASTAAAMISTHRPMNWGYSTRRGETRSTGFLTLEKGAAELSAQGQRVGVLAQRPPLRSNPRLTWINAGTRPESYAHDLYAHLRTLDRVGASCLLVQQVPADEPWDAVRDRLTRAAAAHTTELP